MDIHPLCAVVSVHAEFRAHVEYQVHNLLYQSQGLNRIHILAGTFVYGVLIDHVATILESQGFLPEAGRVADKWIGLSSKVQVIGRVPAQGQRYAAVAGVALLPPQIRIGKAALRANPDRQ